MNCVLITGASSGIGYQLARDYARAGWQVLACGRNAERLAELACHSLLIQPVCFDHDNPQQVHDALTAHPAPQLVILNAGDCHYLDDPGQLSVAALQTMLHANLFGAVTVLHELLPRLERGSRIGWVSSAVTLLPLPRAELYGTAKAAGEYLARTLAITLATYGLSLSLIRPGFVDTPLTRRNDFAMPTLISVSEASRQIRDGLAAGRAVIDFPRRLHWPMRLLSWLPGGLWRRVALRMIQRAPTVAAGK